MGEINTQQTEAEKLEEYARSEGQGAGRSPPNTRSEGSAEAAKHKAAEKTERLESQSKLTLEEVNAQLLAAIQNI